MSRTLAYDEIFVGIWPEKYRQHKQKKIKTELNQTFKLLQAKVLIVQSEERTRN